MTLWTRIARPFACGFGLGYAPVASGTFGSLPGLLLAWLMLWLLPNPWIYTAVALALAAVAIPICQVGESIWKKKDPGQVVADEYLLLPLVYIGLPVLEFTVPVLGVEVPVLLGTGFLIARFWDIIKPPPARRWEHLPGGLGVVADDFVASLYSLATHWLLWLGAVRVFDLSPA